MTVCCPYRSICSGPKPCHHETPHEFKDTCKHLCMALVKHPETKGQTCFSEGFIIVHKEQPA